MYDSLIYLLTLPPALTYILLTLTLMLSVFILISNIPLELQVLCCVVFHEEEEAAAAVEADGLQVRHELKNFLP